MTRLVVTGDDFGLSPSVNRAICEAYDRGILTCASLMVGAPAAAEAVTLARARPELAVGLHLTVVDGFAASPRRAVPRLAGPDGRLRASPWHAGLVYQFSQPARTELALEIRRQLELFRETGLHLSHVDGHHHMHLHPVVLRLLVGLAREFRIRWVRVPSDDLGLALKTRPRAAATALASAAAFAALRRSARRRLSAVGIRFADRVYGLHATGRLREEDLLRLLPRVRGDVAEIYCHPGASSGVPARDEELEALLSKRVRTAITAQGLRLGRFAAAGWAPAPRASGVLRST